MVTNVTSFSRSGLSDWLLQRVTAIVMAAYSIFMVVYLVSCSDISYQAWVGLHQNILMKIFSLAAIVSIAVHAWIGLWAVLTDYVTVRLMGPKATPLRVVLQLGMIIVILAYVVWAIDILWGI